MKRIVLVGIVLLIIVGGAPGRVLPSTAGDYEKLNLDTLPPIQIIVKEAVKVSTSGNLDIKREIGRIYKSNLVPLVRLQFGETSRPGFEYGVSGYSRDFEFTDIDENVLPNSYSGVDQAYGPQRVSSRGYLSWNVMAKWYLSDLIIDREELYLTETQERSSYYQRRTVENVVAVYSHLRELLVEKIQYPDDPSLKKDIVAAAVEIDFLTGGFLTKTFKGLKTPLLVKEPAISRIKTEGPVLFTNGYESVKGDELRHIDPTRDPQSPLYELNAGALPDNNAESISDDSE